MLRGDLLTRVQHNCILANIGADWYALNKCDSLDHRGLVVGYNPGAWI